MVKKPDAGTNLLLAAANAEIGPDNYVNYEVTQELPNLVIAKMVVF